MNTQKEIIDNCLLLFLQTRKLNDDIKNQVYNDYKNKYLDTYKIFDYSKNNLTPIEYVKKLKKKK